MRSPGDEPAIDESQIAGRKRKGIHLALHMLWQSALGGTLILIPGAIGYLAGNPWLFPSLGPTAFMQVVSPYSKQASIYNTLAGHLAGMVCAYFSTWACGAIGTPGLFTSGELNTARVLASGLGIALMVLLQMSLKARHPPGAATALLITLGGFKANWHEALAIIVGVTIVTITGEIARRLHRPT